MKRSLCRLRRKPYLKQRNSVPEFALQYGIHATCMYMYSILHVLLWKGITPSLTHSYNIHKESSRDLLLWWHGGPIATHGFIIFRLHVFNAAIYMKLHLYSQNYIRLNHQTRILTGRRHCVVTNWDVTYGSGSNLSITVSPPTPPEATEALWSFLL